jgi:hypothetical protein
MNYIRQLALSAALCGLCFGAQAQSKPGDAAAQSTPEPIADASANFDGRITEASRIVDADTKFKALRGIRNELTRTIDETKAQRSALQDEIARQVAARKEFLPPPGAPPVVSPDAALASLNTARERFKSAEEQLHKLAPSDSAFATASKDVATARENVINAEGYANFLKSRKEQADKNQKELDSLDAKIAGLRGQETIIDKALKKLTVSQTGLDEEINDTLRTDGQRNVFKSEIAFAFAILVALVIGGFFFVAWKDEVVRRAIFSGESGIQFLTLFSVVIAIILFGITGILESKELAALLGGLSGYILGRVTTSRT